MRQLQIISLTGHRIKQGIGLYFQPRVLLVMFLGFSAGLPLALSGSTLMLWMTELNVSLSHIGLYSLVGLPYTLKFLWAPAVDAFKIPFLTRHFGRRRGWLLFSQILLVLAILFLGLQNPSDYPFIVALGAAIVAFISATQDIVIDAFRIESLKPEEQAAGMASYVAAYRVAMLVSSAGVLILVDWLEKSGVASDMVWFYGYAFAASMMAVGIIAVLLSKEPANPHFLEITANITTDETTQQQNAFMRFLETARAAFSDFLSRKDVIAILAFIVLYKFCDAMAGIMTGPFVLKLGFSKSEYAGVVKGVGLAAVLIGGFTGGMIAKRVTMLKALWIGAILQMLSNLMFAWQALIGVNIWALTLTILIENFAAGVGTVIFVAYLSALCGNHLHTATQFALLSALTAVGRTLLSSWSGYIVEVTGWPVFFIITAAFALPALALLMWLQSRGHFNAVGGFER